MVFPRHNPLMPSIPGLRRTSAAISPTAHYTGQVWTRNGLSHPGLATSEGRALFASLQPAMKLSQASGGATLEGMLMARHRAIDSLLERAIEDGGVSQVIEVACGMSPRGWRFTELYGDRLTYIEADLPAMAARKQHALEQIGSISDTHRVVEVDALAKDGPTSMAQIAASLDRSRGLAIITEGLLGYLPGPQVLDVWSRFASLLGEFENNLYLADLHVGTDVTDARSRAVSVLIGVFVRGRVHIHFADTGEAEQALLGAGFSDASVRFAGKHIPDAGIGGRRVQVVEASV